MLRGRSHAGTEIALANFALTFAKALLVFCVVMFVMISPDQGRDGTKPKAEYLISMEWSGEGRNDVDLWTRTPDGKIISYSNRESGVVFLERDDLGTSCNATTNNARPTNVCEEITVIRGIVAGEYTTAVHLFSAAGTKTRQATVPVNVRVKIEKLNPNVRVVWSQSVTLDTIRQELPIVRFHMNPEGQLSEFTTTDLPEVVYQGRPPL